MERDDLVFKANIVRALTKYTHKRITKRVKMERDDLVFKAKLAEQAERYVFCALLRVARWFLRVDFERRF